MEGSGGGGEERQTYCVVGTDLHAGIRGTGFIPAPAGRSGLPFTLPHTYPLLPGQGQHRRSGPGCSLHTFHTFPPLGQGQHRRAGPGRRLLAQWGSPCRWHQHRGDQGEGGGRGGLQHVSLEALLDKARRRGKARHEQTGLCAQHRLCLCISPHLLVPSPPTPLDAAPSYLSPPGVAGGGPEHQGGRHVACQGGDLGHTVLPRRDQAGGRLARQLHLCI